MNEHHKSMISAYAEATKRLRTQHINQFHVFLDEVYAERGMEVKKRLRGQRLLDKKIADAKALLAEASEVTASQ